MPRRLGRAGCATRNGSCATGDWPRFGGLLFQFSAGIPIGLTLLGFISTKTASLAVSVLAVCGFCVLGVGSIMTFLHMTRLAADEVGRGYAIRHLILAILLWPILLLGIFVVPALVEEDVIRLREDELRHQAR